MKLLELFSGYGTASFALKQLGIPFELVGYSDIDKYANQCFELNHNLGHKPLSLGDVRNINPNELPNFDLLTGGFPCQAFSVAGKRKGEADPRGTLFYEIIRIAEVKKPKYMLLENVKGLTNKTFKDTFNKILSELDRIGYNVYWKVLNTKDFGIPQSRARVWFVCFRKDIDVPLRFQFPQPFPLTIFIKDILEKEVDKKYYLSEKLQERFSKYLNEKGKDLEKENISPRRVRDLQKSDSFITSWDLNLLSPTLSQKMGTGGNNVPMIANCIDSNYYKGVNINPNHQSSERGIITNGQLRRLTPKECFRLQGFLNDEVEFGSLSDTQLYKLAGNGQSVNVVKLIFKEMFKH